MNAFWTILLLGAIILGTPADVRAQTTTRSAAAEEALQRGFAMAQRKRWSLAIRYFGNAQELAPTDPIVLFNLALANDRASGRNVIAAAWYRAYLEAAPTASNAAKVRARVVDLEIEVESTITDMLETALAVSAQLKDQSKIAALSQITGAQAVSGNLQAAIRSLASLSPGSQSDWARARVAAAQAKKGDLAGAKTSAQSIKRLPTRRWVLAEIAVHEALRKDFTAAIQTAGAVGAGNEQDFAFSRIAALQAKAGDLTGAGHSKDRISKTATAQRIAADAAIAGALVRSGLPWLTKQAVKILNDGLSETGSIKNAAERQTAIFQIVRAKAAADDAAGARQTASLLVDARFKHLAAQAIAEAQGDVKTAAIHRWSAIAHQATASITMQDISALLDRAKTGDPGESVHMIAAAVEERARFLEAMRTTH